MGKNGFTLVEIIVTVALVAVVAVLMFSLFGQGLGLYSMGVESADEQQNLRQVLSEITNRARLAGMEALSWDSGAFALTVGDDVYSHSAEQVLRNGAPIADRIASFEVSLTDDMLSITVQSSKGTRMSTSLSRTQ